MNLLQILLRTLTAASVSAFFAGNALACTPETEGCVEIGKWELSLGIGAGVRTNPVESSPDIPLVLIPEVNYNGEHFFIQNLDFGAILWQSETQQLNLLATPSYDQVYFHRWSPSNFFINTNAFATAGKISNEEDSIPVLDADGSETLIAPEITATQERDLRNRRTAGLGGLEYNLSTEVIDFQLQYLRDFTGIHHGDEARIALAKHWAAGRHHLIGSLGAIWQSSEVVNYYYGVTPAEADARGEYKTNAALSSEARLDWNYQLTQRWDLRLLARYRQLPDEITASPLINDNKVITFFIGGVYHF